MMMQVNRTSKPACCSGHVASTAEVVLSAPVLEPPERQVSLPRFMGGGVGVPRCYFVRSPSGHADMQTQVFVAWKPTALPWTTAVSCLT